MSYTKDQLIKYIYNSKSVVSLYRSAIGLGFWPDFPDYQIENISWFLEVAEIKDIENIDELINNNKEVLNRYIAQIYASRKNPWRVTPGFLCQLAILAKYKDLFTIEKLIEHGWEKDIALNIISAANIFHQEIT